MCKRRCAGIATNLFLAASYKFVNFIISIVNVYLFRDVDYINVYRIKRFISILQLYRFTLYRKISRFKTRSICDTVPILLLLLLFYRYTSTEKQIILLHAHFYQICALRLGF